MCNGKQASVASVDERAALRRRLWRRLLWKVPVILLLVGFAVWWEWRNRHPESIETQASALAGSWSGEVTYSSGAKHVELFFFQPEGKRLFGTAAFLGHRRGIEEGRLEGGEFSFFIRFQEASADGTHERKNYYWGKLAGSELVMRMQDDRGGAPLEWTLSKNAGAK
jgi:hypothetical protein